MIKIDFLKELAKKVFADDDYLFYKHSGCDDISVLVNKFKKQETFNYYLFSHFDDALNSLVLSQEVCSIMEYEFVIPCKILEIYKD